MDFKEYLKTLSKNQLVEIIDLYAPVSFREHVSNLQLEGDQARKAFEKITKKVNLIFQDLDLMYDPAEFTRVFESLVEKLTGLWGRFPEETGELFLFYLKRIDAAVSEGYLYDHYRDEIYGGVRFQELIQRYAYELPFHQKKSFVYGLEDILSILDYDIFYWYEAQLDKIYRPEELPLLKENYLKGLSKDEGHFKKAYYLFLKEFMSLEEKAYVLSKIYHLGKDLSLDLVQTLVAMEKHPEALDFLKELFETNPQQKSEELFQQMIQLKAYVGESFLSELEEGIRTLASESFLIFAIPFFPEKQGAFESILLEASHTSYFKFLTNDNRIEEAYQLIQSSNKIRDSLVFEFYKKYGKKYPEAATTYFIACINRELPHTGNRPYEAIVSYLKIMRKFNPVKVNEVLLMLRTEYKRRRNLMNLLEGM
jgi:hypothetical protein